MRVEVVLLYQLAIFLLILAGALLIGEKGLLLAAAVAAIFTLFNVYTLWLFILQLVTILLSVICGWVICQKKDYKEIRKQAWVWMFLAIGATVWYVLNQTPNSHRMQERATSQGATVSPSPTYPTNISASIDQSRDPQVRGASNRNVEEERMSAVIARLERQYPELDEKSIRFNDQVTEKVLDRQLLFIKQGMLPPEALDRAANEIMSARPVTVRPSHGSISVACRRSDGSYVAEPCRKNEERVIQNVAAVQAR